MKYKKTLTLTFGIFVFSALVCFPLFNCFAYDGTQVVPKKKIFDICKKSKKFSEDDDVYAKAKNLFPNRDVDIYVTENRRWRFGDLIGTDQGDGMDTVQTDSKGRLPDPEQGKCVLMIWEHPLTVDWYDIVVDVNQDGTYNQGDAVFDRTERPGFKVID